MAAQQQPMANGAAERRAARQKAADEARELIDRMRVDIDAISSFLTSEQESAARRGLSSKRLARLRLMSDDLSSAQGFATKPIKP